MYSFRNEKKARASILRKRLVRMKRHETHEGSTHLQLFIVVCKAKYLGLESVEVQGLTLELPLEDRVLPFQGCACIPAT